MAEIERNLNRLRKLIHKPIISFKAKIYNIIENKKRKPCVKKIAEFMDRAIVRKSKKDPFMSSRDVSNEIYS